MNRETLLALFASAISEPWAVRREWMTALSAAAASVSTAGAAELGNRRIRAPAAIKVLYVKADGQGDDHDEDDQIDDVDAVDKSCEDEEDKEDCDGEPAEATVEPGEEGDEEYHPDPNSTAPATPAAAVHPNTARATARKPGSIAVIPINGTISPKATIFDWLFGTTPTTPGSIAKAVTDAGNDESVKAIILHIDSGGGPTPGITECWKAIYAVRGKKPIVAQVANQCGSAAYWLASACDEIAATESATVGSIGVYMAHDDVSKMLDTLGVKRTYIQAGEFKTEGAPEEPLSDEAKAHFQEYVDDFMGQFAGDVAKGRSVTPATVTGESYGQGRAFIAGRALKRGMIDKVRPLSETLAGFGASLDDPQAGKTKGRALGLLRREVDALDL